VHALRPNGGLQLHLALRVRELAACLCIKSLVCHFGSHPPRLLLRQRCRSVGLLDSLHSRAALSAVSALTIRKCYACASERAHLYFSAAPANNATCTPCRQRTPSQGTAAQVLGPCLHAHRSQTDIMVPLLKFWFPAHAHAGRRHYGSAAQVLVP